VLASVLLSGAAVIAAETAPAAPTGPPAIHLRGTVSAISPTSITVTTATGPVAVALNDKTTISGVTPGSVNDLTPGSYIGAVNVPVNGGWRAVSINIFPPAARGRGIGDRPWETAAAGSSSMTNGTIGGGTASSMTNGTVGGGTASSMTNGTVKPGGAHTIVVDYGDGAKTLEIPATVSVLRIVPATMDQIVPGAHVFVNAVMVDGKSTATRISVGQNGAIPT